MRIYNTYGDQAVEIVKQNPYRLATDIWGIGFQTADQIALKMGMDRNSPLRAQAAVLYVLQEFSGDGHVGYPEEGVVQAAINATQIHRDIIQAAVEQSLASGEASEESGSIEIDRSGFLEATLRRLGCRQVSPRERRTLPDRRGAAAGVVEKRMKLTLADTQRAAIRAAVTEKVMVITGGPGTG